MTPWATERGICTKLMTLATWAASEERDEAGMSLRSTAAAPALRRDREGLQALPPGADRPCDGRHDPPGKEQQQLQSELAAVGIPKKYPGRLGAG